MIYDCVVVMCIIYVSYNTHNTTHNIRSCGGDIEFWGRHPVRSLTKLCYISPRVGVLITFHNNLLYDLEAGMLTYIKSHACQAILF